MISDDEWAAALTLLRRADEVCLLCHVRPDGDALGSMLGLAQALRSRGARVLPTFEDAAHGLPESLAPTPGAELIVLPEALPAVPQVVVTLDTGSRGRLGRLEPLAAAAEAVVVIDHHVTNTRYGTHHLVDPQAPATAAVVAELVDRLGLSLTAPVAEALYTGLVTDTGSFRFASTSPETHRLAARLVATGFGHDAVSRRLFDTNRLAYLKLLSRALARAVLEPAAAGGRGLVWTSVPARDRADLGVTVDEVERVVSSLRTAAEAEVAAVLKEDDAGVWVVSLRARETVDVGAVCTGFGGGGHRLAAGFTSPWPADETVRRLRDALSGSAE